MTYFSFGRLRELNGEILAPDVFGFNNGIIFSEFLYGNLNVTSESVSKISEINLEFSISLLNIDSSFILYVVLFCHHG